MGAGTAVALAAAAAGAELRVDMTDGYAKSSGGQWFASLAAAPSRPSVTVTHPSTSASAAQPAGRCPPGLKKRSNRPARLAAAVKAHVRDTIQAAPQRLNYVIASYGGERNCNRPCLHPGPGSYLRLHFTLLAHFRHKLAQVTVLRPPLNRSQPRMAGYYDVPGVSLGAPVVWLDTQHNHGSYPGLFAAWERWGAAFSHYLVMEDDYVPYVDDFDSTLLRVYAEKFPGGYGMLCGMLQGRPAEPNSPHPLHPEGSVLMSARALAAVDLHMRCQGQSALGFFPSACSDVVGKQRWNCVQVAFGVLMKRTGMQLADWRSAGRAPYWQWRDRRDGGDGIAVDFPFPGEEPTRGPPLVIPLHLVYRTDFMQCRVQSHRVLYHRNNGCACVPFPHNPVVAAPRSHTCTCGGVYAAGALPEGPGCLPTLAAASTEAALLARANVVEIPPAGVTLAPCLALRAASVTVLSAADAGGTGQACSALRRAAPSSERTVSVECADTLAAAPALAAAQTVSTWGAAVPSVLMHSAGRPVWLAVKLRLGTTAGDEAWRRLQPLTAAHAVVPPRAGAAGRCATPWVVAHVNAIHLSTESVSAAFRGAAPGLFSD